MSSPSSRRAFLRALGGGLAWSWVAGRAPLSATRRVGEGEQAGAVGEGAPLAVFLVLADTHSAHDRYPRIVSEVDRVLARYPGVPLLVLFNGDLFEGGDVVAQRGRGIADLDFLSALEARAPVVFNLGNHEGALFELPECVRLLETRGIRVVTNVRGGPGAAPLAPPAVTLPLGGRRATVVGMATNDLSTYRPAAREGITIPDGPDYAAERMTELLGDVDFRVVLSHEGTVDDRRALDSVPDGSLVIGGHDHLRYTYRRGRSLYLHTGWWAEEVALVTAHRDGDGIRWESERIETGAAGPRDPDLEAIVTRERATHLRAEDLEVIAGLAGPLSQRAAALAAMEALRRGADADVALMANTSFGAGLPAGEVTRYDFDAFVRFDGVLHVAEVDAAGLRRILARANQFDDVRFTERTGEFVVASTPPPLEPSRRYRLATDAWVPLNALRYLGTELEFRPCGGRRIKELIAAELPRLAPRP